VVVIVCHCEYLLITKDDQGVAWRTAAKRRSIIDDALDVRAKQSANKSLLLGLDAQTDHRRDARRLAGTADPGRPVRKGTSIRSEEGSLHRDPETRIR